MGKKKSEIQGAKLLRKQIPPCLLIRGESGYDSLTLSVANGWELYWSDGAIPFLVYRTYFDVAGWSREQLSAFIEGVGWQEPDGFNVIDPNPAAGFGEMETWDIVSKATIPNEALDAGKWLYLGQHNWSAPGFSGSNYNMEEIFAGRYRQYLPNSTTLGLFQQTDQQIWGCGDATAGDKIHITRVVSLYHCISPENTADYLMVPEQLVLSNAIVVDEKDLVYMERLRRSYVLGESRNP